MADNEKTITTIFRADITQFSSATQQLNRNVANINSEFKNATASMDKWNNNVDGLKAKITQLNGTLDQEKTRLQMLKNQYAELVNQGKANTKEAQQLATAINNQSAKVKETEKNIKYYSNSLKELESAGVKTKDELDKLNKKLDEQKQAAKELGGSVLKGAALGVAGFAAACLGALKGVSGIVEETKELRTQMGQLETTFSQQGHSVDATKKTFNELVGVLGDTGKATEAAMHLGQIAKSEKELTDYTNILTGVYATFGDSLPVEGLAEAMNHTANLGSVQGNLADALEWAGVNVDDFNKQLGTLNTEEERAQLINSTLNGIYGETSEKYKEVNKEVIAANEAQNKYNQAMAEIGEKAQPAITSFKLAMVEVLQTIMNKFKDVDIEGLIGKITGAITTLVNVALPPLMTGLTWVLDNANWLVPVLGSIVGLIGGITAAINIYNGVVKVARAVQLAWNLAMSANPIGLVVVAVTGLVAAFAVLWNKCEGFRNFFKGFVNAIITGVNAIIKGLNKLSFDIPDWVPAIGGHKFGFNIPLIPKLAKGGVVDKPTLAMVGEAGKEAVMPLENNTAWIDKLADKLSGKMQSSNVTYNINNKFEKMETTALAQHKANLELKRIIKGGY